MEKDTQWIFFLHRQVDIYGKCGDHECPDDDPKCHKLFAQKYKFYLAFEKSNCRDYITDELFDNLIDRHLVPIVMGAYPEDYEERAPYRSYIHVDHFKSPEELANYLKVLDANDKLYNRYFEWMGTGEFIDTKFFCRVCALLHDEYYFKSGMQSRFHDLKGWWNGPGICTEGDWREDAFHHSAADDGKFYFQQYPYEAGGSIYSLYIYLFSSYSLWRDGSIYGNRLNIITWTGKLQKQHHIASKLKFIYLGIFIELDK